MKFSQNLITVTSDVRKSMVRFGCCTVHSVLMFLLSFTLSFYGFASFIYDILPNFSVIQLLPGLFTAVFTVLLTEKLKTNNVVLKWILPFCVTIGVVALWHFSNSSQSAINFDSIHGYSKFAFNALCGYVVFIICACVYLLYTNENSKLMFAHILNTICFAFVVSIVFMLGVMLCILAVQLLIFTSYELIYSHLYMSVFNFSWQVVAIVLILSRVPKKDEQLKDPKILYVLTGYVALPIYLVLIAILNVYCLIVLFTWQLPSGTVNWFASFAVLFYIFFCLVLQGHSSKLSKFAIKWCGFALIPIIIVQIICVWVRFSAYGLTPTRYLSISLIVVGIFGVAIFIAKRPPSLLFAFAGIVALLITATPLNIIDVPYYEQTARLQTLLIQNNMLDENEQINKENAENVDEETVDAIHSAYNFLRFSDANKSEFVRNATSGTFEDIYGFDTQQSDTNLPPYKYLLNEDYKKNGLDVSGYTTFYDSYFTYSGDIEDGIISYIPKDSDEPIFEHDVNDELMELYDEYIESGSDENLNYEFILDYETKLIIKSVQYEIYDDNHAEIAHCDWYILKK